MAQISFTLKEANTKNVCLIYLQYRDKLDRFKLSTGEYINAKEWNPKEHRPRNLKNRLDLSELKTLLDNMENDAKAAMYKVRSSEEIASLSKIKEAIRDSMREDKRGANPNLLKFAAQLIETSPKAHNTLKNYKLCLSKLKEYQEYKNEQLDYDSINLNFYDQFTKYLNDQGYSTNYIGTLIKNIKVFMNEALDRNYHTNREFLNRKFRVVNELTDTIYLNEEEIKKLYQLDLSQFVHLEKVRDRFIVGCYTGLRFSDLTMLGIDNFSEDQRMIKIKTQKTGETVVIPVHRYVKEIFNKYEGRFPKSPSNQKFNDYLKEIAQLAELDSKELVTKTIGGKKQERTYKKYELISTHTARRSFATNTYLAEIPSITIMKITGHKTEKAFLKYIRVTKEQNAERLLEHHFFKN